MTATPPAGLQVTTDNWQTPPHLAWAFQHIADLFPTATISRGTGRIVELAARAEDVGAIAVTSPYDGSVTTVDAIMATTFTDGWLVTHGGSVLAEAYPGGMPSTTQHLLMSVSKSLVGCVVGALVKQRVLDLRADVASYVPALVGTGYAGATVRHLLDMRSGIKFSEAYLDPDAEVRLLEQAIGWAPRSHAAVPDGLYPFLASLQRKGPHGGAFEYRSCETDVLGWVCEQAAGVPMPQLMSDLLWSRLGAEEDANIGVDAHGAGMYDGGVSATLAGPGPVRADAGARRCVADRRAGRAGLVGPRQLRRRSGLARGLRRQPGRQPDAGRDVPQPVLAALPGPRCVAVLGDPRSDGLREPDRRCRRRQAVELADPAGRGRPVRHCRGVRRHRRERPAPA